MQVDLYPLRLSLYLGLMALAFLACNEQTSTPSSQLLGQLGSATNQQNHLSPSETSTKAAPDRVTSKLQSYATLSTSSNESAVGKIPGNSANPSSPRSTTNLPASSNSRRRLSSRIDRCSRELLRIRQLDPDLEVPLSDVEVFRTSSIENYDDALNVLDFILHRVVSAENHSVDYKRLKTDGDLAPFWEAVTGWFYERIPVTTSEDRQVAFWINTFNLLVVANKMNDKTVNMLETRQIGRLQVTLGQIKAEILQLRSTDLKEQPYMIINLADQPIHDEDARILLALACDTVGCPELRNRAYREGNLDKLLDENLDLYFSSSTYQASSSFAQQNALFFKRIFEEQGDSSSMDLVLDECRERVETLQAAQAP